MIYDKEQSSKNYSAPKDNQGKKKEKPEEGVTAHQRSNHFSSASDPSVVSPDDGQSDALDTSKSNVYNSQDLMVRSTLESLQSESMEGSFGLKDDCHRR